MRIRELIWPQHRIEHVASHGVRPDEVEEVCFGDPLVLRARTQGKNPAYYVLGRTDAGRHLLLRRDSVPGRERVPRHGAADDRWRAPTIQPMEKAMRKIPQTDSITELARFWDTHDLTEFEEELEEVPESVFERDERTVVSIRLDPEQVAALRRFAQSAGVQETDLVAQWVREKLRVS